MNISDFVRANSANSYLTGNSNTTTSQVAKASGQGLQKAEQRIQTMADTTSAQLSSFGKLKSAVSDAQTGARALAGFSTTTKPADVKTALTGFVSAFNTALTAAKTTTGVSGDSAASQSANRVNRDLQRSTNADTANLGTLKKIGVTAGVDGKLAIDATKLGAALTANPTEVRDTLAKLGRQVEQAATKELATDGDVGRPLSALNQRATVLKSQQATLASLSSQTAASAQPRASNTLFGYGVSAYQSGFV
jgi:flagellar capping protein FliD